MKHLSTINDNTEYLKRSLYDVLDAQMLAMKDEGCLFFIKKCESSCKHHTFCTEMDKMANNLIKMLKEREALESISRV